MFDYTAIIVAIITSISTIAGIYLKEWLFPKRKEQKLTIEKSNCYIELDKICASIRDTIHANAVYIAYFHNGGHFINGVEMDKYTVVGEDYDCCVVSYFTIFLLEIVIIVMMLVNISFKIDVIKMNLKVEV